MHLTTRPRILSFALKTLTGAVASAVLFSSAAYAAGLGKLTVLSSLGQPLRAEIELTAVSSDEAGALVAKLAPPEAFRMANIEFNPALLSLRFAVEQRGGRQIIRITSSQPVNEPFVDMLLELSWNSGRLVREYTFLLDPAELRATQPAQVSSAAPVDVLTQGVIKTAPAPQSRSAAPPAAVAKVPAAAAPAAPAEVPRPRASSPAAASEYKVKAGDTLGRVAARLKPVDVSLDMMLVALYRANPDAFVNNNMNRLKAGRILAVPDSDAIRGSSESEAHGVVVAHAADFNAYRNKLAGQVASAAPAKAQENTQSAAGKITAKVEERPTAANESKDQLKLSKATPAAAANGKGAAVSTEDAIAKDRKLADATARVKELEKNVSDLEKLMTVKTKAGAEAQKPLPELTPAPVAARAAKPAIASAPASASASAAASAPVKRAPIVKKAAPAPEPGIVDMLMDNMTYIGAGAAVLLLALFGLSRRRKPDDKSPTEPSILGAPTDQAHSLFAETGGQSIDTNNSVFNSSFAPSASQLDTNEVDPVAEADVYIAYGRDAQAEEILKEALRTHPERHPVRLKLLEIYAARKDQRSFESNASEMYAMTKGQGEDWAQAAALGLSIDPLNPLYASAAGASADAMDSAEQALLTEQLGDALSAGQHDASASVDAPSSDTSDHAAKAEENTLDFDLGSLNFEPVSTTEPIAMPGPAADSAPDLAFDTDTAPTPTPAESSYDMDFDLAFDSPAAPAAAEAAAPKAALDDISLDLPDAGRAADFGMADLAREFDLEPAAASASAEPVLDPLMDLDAMNFDLPAAAAPAAPPALDSFDLPGLPGAAPAPSYAAAEPQFDMSNIDLDLPSSGAAVDELEMATSDAGDNSASHMEMETKLDLAIAYQEIGDKEGARELLDEVIKGGSREQVGKANELRSKLG